MGQRNAHECSYCRLFRDIIPRKELSIERHSLHLVDDVANGLICIAGYRQRPLTTLMDFQSKSFYLVGQDSNGIASDPKQPGEARRLRSPKEIEIALPLLRFPFPAAIVNPSSSFPPRARLTPSCLPLSSIRRNTVAPRPLTRPPRPPSNPRACSVPCLRPSRTRWRRRAGTCGAAAAEWRPRTPALSGCCKRNRPPRSRRRRLQGEGRNEMTMRHI